MLIDYLRYVAYKGRLRKFFEDDLLEYAPPGYSTGQHLRYAPDYLRRLGWAEYLYDRDWPSSWTDFAVRRLMDEIGIADELSAATPPRFEIGAEPSTFSYKEEGHPELEIIIDIDPKYWSERFYGRRSYDNVPVIYRLASIAKGTFHSGDKLFDKNAGRSRYGTLCGVFQTTDGPDYALTCGHVIGTDARVAVERYHRIWNVPTWLVTSILGETRHVAVCPPHQGGIPRTQLDAALIAIRRPRERTSVSRIPPTMVKPISAMAQETPVRFRGAGRPWDTRARVSAITVRKSIDLYASGVLCDVGDVLMLGHRSPMYAAQRVSRPGDSGAAVRRDGVGQAADLREWHGMILGSDDGGAYASYAEHLWAWSSERIGDMDVDFTLDE